MIKIEDFKDVYDTSLVISTIQGKLTEEAHEAWMKTRMFHSQLFALQDEKKKQEKSTAEIVPKEFHKYLDTIFLEREVGNKIKFNPSFEPRRAASFQKVPQHN